MLRCSLLIFAALLAVLLPGPATRRELAFNVEPSQQSGQTPSSERDERGLFLNPGALSPYLLEWYIDLVDDADLRKIWRLLKMDPSSDAPYRCSGNCIAEIFDIPIADNETEKIVALKISLATEGFYQYLFFLAGTGSTRPEWKFIGNIDARGERYTPPVHRVESADNRNWFVVRELWHQDAETNANGEVWYEVQQSRLTKVLSYPLQGHKKPCNQDPGYFYKSILLRYGLDRGIYTVPIQFLITYNISRCDERDDPPPLFSKGLKAFYVWNPEKNHFTLDESQSEIREEEVRSVYSIKGQGFEEMLEYSFSELLDLAKRASPDQRDWLTNNLRKAADSPRKARLQSTLQQ